MRARQTQPCGNAPLAWGSSDQVPRRAPLEATGISLIGTALAMLAWSPRSNAPPAGA